MWCSVQGFDGEVALVLRRHFPSTLLADLQAASQGALVELAQAFPYQPASASLGLTRFMQVRESASGTRLTHKVIKMLRALPALL